MDEEQVVVTAETKGSKITNIITTIFTAIIVILCLFISVFSLTSKANGGAPSFGDTVILNVQSESMTGIIDVGDIIFIKKVTFDENNNPSIPFIENETIVSFKADVNNDGYLDIVTHKYIGKNGNFYRFQGTYKKQETDILDVQTVSSGNIIGVYQDHKIAGVGKLVNFLQSSIGFFICFILPIFLYVCYKGYRLVMTIIEIKDERAVAAGKLTDSEREKERERIRQEILQEMADKEKKE